ncbi:similar to actin binding protein [Plenodomus lingam JN3]|uniref:Similar to actin binding protein n=1 Tax=Leptosphaeria maculans (strain JN3 / isolate v23.1.3 / race Av1-4-5-6-7-8) TaxID=985895 RepID=E4ZVV3_LEPMJ|nr:similar to actin binding protein [Plenodomus lingam JN3]CBX95729.1 similar to actin binding protein [Plenodomus lingam JN3]
MATLNTSSNGPNITRSYQNVVNAPPPSGPQAASPTYAQWAVFTVAAPLVSAFQHDGGKESVLKVQSTGEGELLDLVDEFSDGRVQFAFVKVKDPNTSLPKNVLIAWCGEGVPERTKGYFGSHLTVVSKLLRGYHVQVTARSDADLTPEKIIQKVADASGAKYGGGPDIPSGGPPPVVAKKPVFTPTQSRGGGSAFNPLGRSRAPAPSGGEDADGWGADAPPVSRSQLEKVSSAYQPTKVNMAELTSNRDDSTTAPSSHKDRPEVVRGAYQPVGKVDIAAIRAQAKDAKDDRPTVVKGAYEPVGKVDIAAIRAKAQAGPQSSALPPAATGASNKEEEEERPRSLADRSAAFSSQPERLTSLPKPKVANKFAGASTFTGTKAPTPGGFGAAPAPPPPIVGAASKTFADEGGKTPAQIWAEKKAARGEAVKPVADAGRPTPLQSQQSGGGGWQSGYAGKSWAPVQTTRTGQSAASNLSEQRTGSPPREEPASPPAGAVGSLKDRFSSAAPMGAPSSRPAPEPRASSPPALDTSSKPNAGVRGVPMPGLPTRPKEPESDDEDVPAVQHQRMPSPPRQPRSPSPEPAGSPVRLAMPVSRGKEPEELSPAEEQAPPMPTRSLDQAAQQTRDLSPEPQVEAKDPSRAAAAGVAAATFGAAAVAGAAVGAAAGSGQEEESGSGKRAIVQYDYEKAEDNEVELREGEYVTDIDMVDEDWWMGTNSQGERGLFPANYVELVEGDDNGAAAPPLPSHPAAAQEPEPEPAAQPPPSAAASSGPTATALYDYDAAEDNELSFPENATITNLEFPDEDWWLGSYNGQSGLFPANYVELNS